MKHYVAIQFTLSFGMVLLCNLIATAVLAQPYQMTDYLLRTASESGSNYVPSSGGTSVDFNEGNGEMYVQISRYLSNCDCSCVLMG